MQNHSEQNGSSSKRPRADDTAFQGNRPAKQPRLADQDSFSSQSSSQGSDRSNIRLVRSVLKKLRSQLHTRRRFPSPPNDISPDFICIHASQLARFARHGGPDLRDLRGYPLPIMNPPRGRASKSQSQSRVTKSTDATSVAKTTTTPRSASAYQSVFNEILIDNEIHRPITTPKPSQTIMAAIARPSFLLSAFSGTEFEKFQRYTMDATNEAEVAKVTDTITGDDKDTHPYQVDTSLGNLMPLTEDSIVSAKPDLYYGSRPKSLHKAILRELSRYISPTPRGSLLIVPNFFLEIKGPDGNYGVAIQQARYDGALGARAIHALQNYGKEKPEYDGCAYAFSATYQYGFLTLFSHHVTAPTPLTDGQPEYHMTLLTGFFLLKDRETCIEGINAFRNLRDLAKEYRERFISEANSRLQVSLNVALEDKVSGDEGSGDEGSGNEAPQGKASTSRKRTPTDKERSVSSSRKRAGAGHVSASGSSKRLRDTQSPSPRRRQASKNRK